MKRIMFALLARLNKKVLPVYSKKQLDLFRVSKLQVAIIGWRYYVTKQVNKEFLENDYPRGKP